MQDFLDAIVNGATAEELSTLPVPDHYRAAYVRRSDARMFEGVPSNEKDPRLSIQVGDVGRHRAAPQ